LNEKKNPEFQFNDIHNLVQIAGSISFQSQLSSNHEKENRFFFFLKEVVFFFFFRITRNETRVKETMFHKFYKRDAQPH